MKPNNTWQARHDEYERQKRRDELMDVLTKPYVALPITIGALLWISELL